MLIQDLSYVETTANQIKGAAGALGITIGEALATSDDGAFTKIISSTNAISAPNFNFASGGVISVSTAI